MFLNEIFINQQFKKWSLKLRMIKYTVLVKISFLSYFILNFLNYINRNTMNVMKYWQLNLKNFDNSYVIASRDLKKNTYRANVTSFYGGFIRIHTNVGLLI